MIIIHPLKVAFQNVPKVGTTSLFAWFYKILVENLKIEIETKNYRRWIKEQQSEIIENQPVENFICPKDYLVFCLIRDPVKRLLSAYSNRVLHHNELNFRHREIQKRLGHLAARPTLNYFVEHLEDYRAISNSISHHTLPLVDFLGKDISIYNYIFDLSEMSLLRQKILEHWHLHKILENEEISEIPHLQTGGKKFFLDDLTESNFEKCLNFYANDYQTFPALDKEKICQARRQAYTNIEVKPELKKQLRVKAKNLPIPNILTTLKINDAEIVINNGITEPFSGVVLLNSTESNRYQLIASDARGEWILRWNQPSPKIAKLYSDNPYACKSRFIVQKMEITDENPIKIFIEDDLGKRQLLFVVKMENS